MAEMNPMLYYELSIELASVGIQVHYSMDDIEIKYFGEEDGMEGSGETTDDFERRRVRVNEDGKKIRGKDMFWTKKIRFNNPREYEASNIIQELNEGYTRKQISEFEYRTVYNYVCFVC